MKKKIAVTGLIAAAILTPAIAGAVQPTPTVPVHRHFVVSSSGELVPVGPDSCANGQSVQFDNFHLNVHRGAPGAHGVVVSTACP